MNGTKRWPAPLALDLVWLRRGSFDDTVLSAPQLLAAKDGILLVPDSDRGGYHVIDGASGELRTFVGRRGRGPGEFMHMIPVSLSSPEGDASFKIVDHVNQRITLIDASGMPLAERRVKMPSHVLSACALHGDIFVSTTLSARSRLGRIRRSDDSVSFLAAEWRRHRDTLDAVTGQFRLKTVAPGLCALLPSLGPDPAYLFDARDELRTVLATRESAPATQAEQTSQGEGKRFALPASVTYAWRDMVAIDTLLLALYAGQSEERNRLVDVFRMSDGKYIGTVTLPWRARRIESDGLMMYSLGQDVDGYFRLAGFRVQAISP